jgi:Domain of unknown function DUF11/PASTA domain
MLRRNGSIATAIAFLALVFTTTASADTTLGSLEIPGGSPTAVNCSGYVVAELSSATGVQFTVPDGGGAINEWQMNTTGANPGDQVTLLVLRLTAGNVYTVVGSDTETLPNQLPADQVAAFSMSTPIVVRGGETLGLTASPAETCGWSDGSTPNTDAMVAMPANGPFTAGQTLTPQVEHVPARVNVAANLVVRQDVGVTASAVPSTVTLGTPALLTSTVSNAGPSSSAFTVASGIPAGLTIDSAAAGSGTCTISSQQVTCTITGLAPGQSVPLDIVVTPTAAHSYAYNVLAVTGGMWPDPNPANNTASAQLTAVPAPIHASQCLVPNLKGVRAQVAKKMLSLLGCRVGNAKRVHSRSVRKGAVIKTTPGPGTYAAGKVVNIRISSGRGGRKHH